MALMQRERHSEREDETPLLSTNSDIFEGLSFPEPPTTTPVVRTVPYSAASLSSYDNAITPKPAKIVTLSDDLVPKSLIQKPPLHVAPQTQSVTHNIKNKFNSLYSSEKPVAREDYPVLSDDHQVAPRQQQNRASLHATTTTGMPGALEMRPWGKNHGEATNYTNMPSALTIGPSAPTATAASDSSSVSLVHDLLDENARLKRQLEEISRGSMSHISSVCGPVVTGFGSTQQSTVPTPNSLANLKGESATVSGTNPQQTQKFVCCGGCKQWLSAPRDANLVYCPGCEAVNDCSLAERGSSNAPRRLETQPWYLQCFQRFLG